MNQKTQNNQAPIPDRLQTQGNLPRNVWIILIIVVIVIAGFFIFRGGEENMPIGEEEVAQEAGETTVQEEGLPSGEEESTTTVPNQLVTVTYTASGFEPSTIEINEGDSVMWVNESGEAMWVASAVHPTHQELPGFDQLSTGTEYTYSFTQSGTWRYHNHVNSNETGTVVVN